MNNKISRLAWAGLMASVLASGAALADGMPGSIKDAPAEPQRDLKFSFNAGITSDYVFRGFSQSAENPTFQAGIDLTYKWFYVGTWASGIDFGLDANLPTRKVAHTELDIYAGVKPVLGKFTFDFGVIAYTYPGQISSPLAFNRDLNYYEGKAGVSVEAWKDGTIGATLFYSPEYTNKQGGVWTVEGSISQVLPKLHSVTPTFSALIGYQTGDDARYKLLTTNGASDYLYWNAGLMLGFGDNFTLDLRYWDTNVSNAGNFCDLTVLQCDARFVATAKFTY